MFNLWTTKDWGYHDACKAFRGIIELLEIFSAILSSFLDLNAYVDVLAIFNPFLSSGWTLPSHFHPLLWMKLWTTWDSGRSLSMAGGWNWMVFEFPSNPNHPKILWCLFFLNSEFTFTSILIDSAFNSSAITLGYVFFNFFKLENINKSHHKRRRKVPKPSFLCLVPNVLEKQGVSWLTKLAWCMNWILNVTAMQVL